MARRRWVAGHSELRVTDYNPAEVQFDDIFDRLE